MSLREQFEKETGIKKEPDVEYPPFEMMSAYETHYYQKLSEWLESKVAELQSENNIKDKAIETWTRNFNRQAEELTTLKKENERLKIFQESNEHDTYRREEKIAELQSENERLTKHLATIRKGHTKMIEYDLSPAMVESELRKHLIEKMGWIPPEVEKDEA